MVSSAVSYTSGNAAVVTQALPEAPNGEQQPPMDRRHNFRKGHSKALGIAQIISGALMLLFGIVMAFYLSSAGLATRFTEGAAFIYITSGAVTVAAEKSLSHCLINTSLAFNVIAAMTAAVAVILCAFGLVAMSLMGVFSFQDYNGVYFVLLAVLQFVELFLSVIAARCACNATGGCCAEDPQVVVQAVEGPNSTQPPPYFQTSVAPTHPYPEADPDLPYGQSGHVPSGPGAQKGPLLVAPNVNNQGDLGSAEPPPYNLTDPHTSATFT